MAIPMSPVEAPLQLVFWAGGFSAVVPSGAEGRKTLSTPSSPSCQSC
jgi:hypothetical protein